MKIVHNGKEYQFPEGASLEKMNKFFENQSGGGNAQPQSSEMSPERKNAEDILGIHNTPFGDIKNLAAGATHGLLSLPRMMDLHNMVPKNQQGALIHPQGQSPIDRLNEFKAFGTTDQPLMSRGGMEQGLGEMLGIGPSVAKVIPDIGNVMAKSIPFAKHLINSMRPGKESANFLKDLSGETASKIPGIEPNPFRPYSQLPQPSSRVSAEQNTKNISQDVAASREKQLKDALQHKENVFNAEGKENIYKNPASSLPEGNLDKLARIITNKKEDLTADNINKLDDALKKYRKDEDIQKFSARAEDIFSKDLTENQIEKLEHVFSIPTHRTGEYEAFHDFASKDPSLNKLHDKFVNKPTLNNYDKLQQQMNADLGYYKDLAAKKKLEPKDRPAYDQLKKAKSALEKDVTFQLERKNPSLASELKKFKEKYRENVTPYDSSTILTKISNGKTEGITDSNIRGIFGNPDKHVKKVLKDLPRETKNKIIYNELHSIRPTDHEALLEKLDSLEQSKGYKEYFTPEINVFRRSLAKKGSRLNNLKGLGVGSALTATGHPILGTMAGIGVAKGKPIVNALIKAFKK